jgi:DHA1 family 2-module integral membrane pump EmrD-like MFS transporter
MSTPLTGQTIQSLIVLVALGVIGLLGVDIHLASLPHIMAFMHTNKAHMQQSVSLFLLGLGLSLLIYGPLPDNHGRKPIVLIGLSIAAISSFASCFTHHITPFLITRLIQGIGFGVCMGLGRTMVADLLSGEQLAAVGSYFGMFLALSPLFGPAIGGYVQHYYGWQANFMLLGALALFVMVIYSLFCPETNHHKQANAFHIKVLCKNYASLLKHPAFLASTCIAGMAVAATMVYATTSSFIFQDDFHLSPIQYGWICMAASLGMVVGKLITPLCIKHFTSHKTLFVGCMLTALAGLWIIIFNLHGHITLILTIIAISITLFAQAFIATGTMPRALGPFHDKRGSAGALFGSFQMLVAFVASAILGGYAHAGVMALGISYVILGTIAVLMFVLFIKE